MRSEETFLDSLRDNLEYEHAQFSTQEKAPSGYGSFKSDGAEAVGRILLEAKKREGGGVKRADRAFGFQDLSTKRGSSRRVRKADSYC